MPRNPTKRNPVVIDSRQARRLLRGDDVLGDMQDRTARVAAAAGPGFEANVYVGYKRVIASVSAVTDGAQYDEATTRSLTMALDAAR